MGLNFYYNDGLQPKMRAGIINEHECRTQMQPTTQCEFLANFDQKKNTFKAKKYITFMLINFVHFEPK